MIESFLLVPVMLATLVAPHGAAPPASLRPLAITPDRFEARVGTRVELRLDHAGAATPLRPEPAGWRQHPTSWFSVRVAGSQENLDSPPGVDGAAGADAPIRIDLAQPGVTMIGAEFAPVTVSMTTADVRDGLGGVVTASELDAALKGLDAAKSIRVKVIRGAKAFVRVLPKYEADPVPADAQTAGSKFGHVSEVRLLLNALDMTVGGSASVRLHADYEKAGGTTARAVNLDTGHTQEFVADRSGIGTFRLDERGRWRVTFTTARRAPDGTDADVIVYAASVTFAVTREEAAR